MKNYVRPEMMIETFMADEFVSACDDQGVTYDFVCNGGKMGQTYLVYLDDGDGKYDPESMTNWNGDESLGGYTPCNETHSVTVPRGTSIKNVFQDGWLSSGGNSAKKVIVWTANGTNVHCTENLSITEWGKNRS